MAAKSVLLLAYAFPPENIVGAARPARFFKYLPQFGYQPEVITASPPLPTGPPPHVHYVPDAVLNKGRTGLAFQYERLLRRLLLPGECGLTWIWPAVALAPRVAPACTVVFSTFPPLATHFAAYRLKQRYGMRWVADFRDPLTGATARSTASLHRRLDAFLESLIFRHADLIIANTAPAGETWRQRYPAARQRIEVIWNGFDPEDSLEPAPIPPRPYRVLAHVGGLYGGRTANVLLASLDRLVARQALSPSTFRLKLVGPIEDGGAFSDPACLERLTELGCVQCSPLQIPATEARHIAAEADSLLLLEHTPLQAPAKIFDYLRIGRPILAFASPESAVERMLQQSGVPFRCIYPGAPAPDVDRIVLDFFSLPNTPVPASTWFYDRFNAIHQTRQLAGLLDRL